ncbi:hypothetical protein C8F04DRAFT_572697 [Mycena alexandri]|uniref:Uncharacterized protein n=1 Tax=Mycena alexandri TaxID=1745969 RepID=A0AAD6SVE5_9AGAR|nr:hypothetical protein C8F04DRAFT_572697 [Mycena alexandri]
MRAEAIPLSGCLCETTCTGSQSVYLSLGLSPVVSRFASLDPSGQAPVHTRSLVLAASPSFSRLGLVRNGGDGYYIQYMHWAAQLGCFAFKCVAIGVDSGPSRTEGGGLDIAGTPRASGPSCERIPGQPDVTPLSFLLHTDMATDTSSTLLATSATYCLILCSERRDMRTRLSLYDIDIYCLSVVSLCLVNVLHASGCHRRERRRRAKLTHCFHVCTSSASVQWGWESTPI